MKVLHITNWYPTKDNAISAVWISRHIKSLEPYVDYQKIWHIEVLKGKWKLSSKIEILGNSTIFVSMPLDIWLLKEIISTILILWVIFIKEKITKYDIINVHIAYPLLTFINYWKFFLKVPLVIIEHWSAYHFNFGVSKKLKRIQNIFNNKIPLITVSEALKNDISTFSNTNSPLIVIPNIVDINVFNFDQQQSTPYFFMLGFWKEPKDPIKIIQSYEKVRNSNALEFELKIGGYGVLEKTILEYIEKSPFKKNIHYLGKLNNKDSAYYMNNALAFIHISGYETFSVVCAEAICCGTPVIASNVGGIPEFIKKSNGYLVKENNVSQISKAINNMVVNQDKFDRRRISIAASIKFSSENIGALYYKTLSKIATN